MEERRTISPLVAQVLASLAVYGGIIRSATCPKRFCGYQIIVLGCQLLSSLQRLAVSVTCHGARNGNPQDSYVKWVWFMGVA